MRFDDRLATVLALPEDSQAVRIVKWRQIVDLLAHAGQSLDPGQVEQALGIANRIREDIDPDVRREVAATLRARPLGSELATILAGEPMNAGEVSDSAFRWRRRDGADEKREAQDHRREPAAGYEVESSEGSTGAEEGPAPDESQIGELVARIESFRKNGPSREAHAPTELPPVETFRWETGPDGVINWVEGAPRGALIGHTIAAAAPGGMFGVDGQASGAFEKRGPFRDARLKVAGMGPASGDWRISGVPFFHARHGSFLGYRGTARRPRIDETAPASEPQTPVGGLFGTSVPAESLRHLIHELRTPLNAIVGFAEMIDGQYLGPAAADYRSRARDIIGHAESLLAAVDDLDTAARVETGRLDLMDVSTDASGLVQRLGSAFQAAAQSRAAGLTVAVEPGLPAIRVDPAAAERMIARLLGASVGLLGSGEAIRASLCSAAGEIGARLCLAVDRPKAVAGLPDTLLLDPGFNPDGDWPHASLLGLGFSLRLVRNLAEAVGGTLTIEAQRFCLYLPADVSERISSHGT